MTHSPPLSETQRNALSLFADPHHTIDGVLYAANGVSISTAKALVDRGYAEWTAGSNRRDWGIWRTSQPLPAPPGPACPACGGPLASRAEPWCTSKDAHGLPA